MVADRLSKKGGLTSVTYSMIGHMQGEQHSVS